MKSNVFAKDGSGWTELNHSEHTQTGTANAVEVKNIKDESKYIFKSVKLNDKTLTGTVTKKYDTSKTSTIKASGLNYKGSIGVYGKAGSETGKGSNKLLTSGIGIAKKATTTSTSTKKNPVNGKKKTWTGPKLEADG